MDRKKAADLAYAEGYRLGSASRDAEIERLKTVPMRYRRMALNAQLQGEVARLEQENDQLRAHINLTPNDTGNGPRQAQLAEGPR